MKDLSIISAIAPGVYLAQNTVLSPEHFPLWERLLEKWGIGMIGLGLFGVLAYWTYRKEEKAAVKRELKEEQFQAERAALLKENNDLTHAMLENSFKHTANLEALLAKSNEVARDTQTELRYLSEAIKADTLSRKS